MRIVARQYEIFGMFYWYNSPRRLHSLLQPTFHAQHPPHLADRMASGSAGPSIVFLREGEESTASGSAGPGMALGSVAHDADEMLAGPQHEVVNHWPTDEEYKWFWSTDPHGYRQNSTWWPPAPPSGWAILTAMKVEAIRQRDTAPILKPSVTTKVIPEHAKLVAFVKNQGGGPMEEDIAVRYEIQKVQSVNRSGELFNDPRRHGGEGLGYKTPILATRNLGTKKNWDTVGHPSKYIQVFFMECWESEQENSW